MKAISLKQPYANWVASGKKTIETRTWPTKHRGPLLIVSSKSPNIEPAGYALAIVNVVDCRPMTKADKAAACIALYDCAWAWVIDGRIKIEPFPVTGQLGVYEVADPRLNAYSKQVEEMLRKSQN